MEQRNFFQEFRLRLVWLSVGFAGSLLMARFINGFEEILSEHIELAAFIPLIVYMSGAVGTQMEAIVIREINAKKHFHIQTFIRRQAMLVASLGLVFSLAIALITMAALGEPRVSIAVSLGMMGSFVSALITGSFMPYLFWLVHQDPAEASGPIVTIIQDTLSLLIYLFVATLLIA